LFTESEDEGLYERSVLSRKPHADDRCQRHNRADKKLAMQPSQRYSMHEYNENPLEDIQIKASCNHFTLLSTAESLLLCTILTAV